MLDSEKKQILNMVKDGTINIDEGIKLLDALNNSINNTYESNNKAKWLKIKVFDPNDDTNINVTLPISIISLGVKFANKFSPKFQEAGLSEEDMENIFNAVQNNKSGKLIDLDSGDGTKIEIIIE